MSDFVGFSLADKGSGISEARFNREIEDDHDDDYESCFVLECDAVYSSRIVPKFQCKPAGSSETIIYTGQHGVTSRKRAISTYEPPFLEMVSFPASLQFISLFSPHIPTLFAPLYKYRASPKRIMSPGLLLLF